MFSIVQKRAHNASLWHNTMRQMSFWGKFHKKTNVFDKYQYNPNHIPYDKVFKKKNNKPRQKIWDEEDPNYTLAIRPPTQHIGKTLISQLENEERDQIIEARKFPVPEFRSGDVLEVSMYISLSEKKYNTFKGLVIGQSSKNSLKHSFELVCYFCGIITKLDIKVNSPMVAKIEVVKHGSNKIRNKLNHVWDDEWNKPKVEQPIIKGRGFTPRGKKAKPKKRNILGNIEGPFQKTGMKKGSMEGMSVTGQTSASKTFKSMLLDIDPDLVDDE